MATPEEMELQRRRQAQMQARGGLNPGGLYAGYKGISSLFGPTTAGYPGAGAVETLAGSGASSGMLEAAAGAQSTTAPFANAGAAAQFAPASGGALSSLYAPGSDIAGYGTFGQVALPFAGALGARDLYQNWGQRQGPVRGAVSGAATGAAIGSAVPGVGTLIGGGVGALLGGAAGLLKTGKHEDQVKRDGLRASLQGMGFLDEKFNVSLADGSKFNVGVDGGHREPNGVSGGRRAFEVNTENPLHTQAVGWANPIAEIMSGGDDKLRSDFAGYLANAAMSNADGHEGVRANMLNFLAKAGLDAGSATQKLAELKTAGRITEEEYGAYINGLGTMFKGDSKLYVSGPIPPQAQVQAPSSPAPMSAPPGQTQQLSTGAPPPQGPPVPMPRPFAGTSGSMTNPVGGSPQPVQRISAQERNDIRRR
jgi:hypothetical protein